MKFDPQDPLLDVNNLPVKASDALPGGKVYIRTEDWYNWQVEHWGTKWNSYQVYLADQDDKGVTVEYQTAWSAPEPILEALTNLGYKVDNVSEFEGDDEIYTYGSDEEWQQGYIDEIHETRKAWEEEEEEAENEQEDE